MTGRRERRGVGRFLAAPQTINCDGSVSRWVSRHYTRLRTEIRDTTGRRFCVRFTTFCFNCPRPLSLDQAGSVSNSGWAGREWPRLDRASGDGSRGHALVSSKCSSQGLSVVKSTKRALPREAAAVRALFFCTCDQTPFLSSPRLRPLCGEGRRGTRGKGSGR
jgi:hypothetical protein